ncbi:Cof-type HAD-IIB family hydrolase [Paenibacillus zeisoli]|uniref:Cof-type HAD-IIB family hydrolase n=1 Tax=Paenibacillus zeisoli TaxID=2496267 RepID=A0A433X913_9BACL|nr:Cof-type HAD-IIB family hydrolase [Paenibacillus zeisoli]RUT30585.1 Cof-type HAD-IIB family hydrolase [Paenibacillus zeisoli]
MERRLVFFDIDGTLLDHQKKLPDSTVQAIHSLRELGHEVAIATGRAPYAFKEIRETLGVDSFVSLNGQYVVYQGKVIHKNPIDPAIIQSLTEFSIQRNNPILYVGEEAMKMNVVQHDRVDASYLPHQMELPGYDPQYYVDREIFQCIVFCTQEEEPDYLREFDQPLRFVRWDKVATDILPQGGSKAAGISKFIDYAGISREEVVAFGDHLNDIEMLQFVGHGVAMGNAQEAVKRIARYTTRDVGENGIKHGLQKLGLI